MSVGGLRRQPLRFPPRPRHRPPREITGKASKLRSLRSLPASAAIGFRWQRLRSGRVGGKAARPPTGGPRVGAHHLRRDQKHAFRSRSIPRVLCKPIELFNFVFAPVLPDNLLCEVSTASATAYNSSRVGTENVFLVITFSLLRAVFTEGDRTPATVSVAYRERLLFPAACTEIKTVFGVEVSR